MTATAAPTVTTVGPTATAAGYGGRDFTVEPMPDLLLGGLGDVRDPLRTLALESLTDGCLLEDFNTDVAARRAAVCEESVARPTAATAANQVLVATADPAQLRRHGRIDDRAWAQCWALRVTATRERAGALLRSTDQSAIGDPCASALHRFAS